MECTNITKIKNKSATKINIKRKNIEKEACSKNYRYKSMKKGNSNLWPYKILEKSEDLKKKLNTICHVTRYT